MKIWERLFLVILLNAFAAITAEFYRNPAYFKELIPDHAQSYDGYLNHWQVFTEPLYLQYQDESQTEHFLYYSYAEPITYVYPRDQNFEASPYQKPLPFPDLNNLNTSPLLVSAVTNSTNSPQFARLVPTRTPLVDASCFCIAHKQGVSFKKNFFKVIVYDFDKFLNCIEQVYSRPNQQVSKENRIRGLRNIYDGIPGTRELSTEFIILLKDKYHQNFLDRV